MALRELFVDYGEIRLLDVECDAIDDMDGFVILDDAEITHVKATLPSLPGGIENMLEMQRLGFQFVDRQIDVSINLLRSRIDFGPLIRLKPRLTSERREEVLAVALRSFPRDRRFHLNLIPDAPDKHDKKSAYFVISKWVDELEEYYVCEHRGELLGFLAPEKLEERRAFVHLAAVDERFRSSGAALSLYANAAREFKERGFAALDGRISTLNAPVMNIYSVLGAFFSNPTDVFLKEMR
ncbi:MAG: GNAT family N-acetyltransferase [Synergistaceae bacterium]|jgi:hypothetical protein|nr:GNAT family N-acetyltransferase [Synergistaceae bacterium]